MHGIETERTILRLFTMDDLDGLASILGNAQVMKYLELDCKPLSREITEIALTNIIKHWEDKGFGRWAVTDKDGGRLIGMSGFRVHEDAAEMMYILDEPYWGKGVATEIARAILKYGFEVKDFPKIVALTRPANVVSRRILDKIGMNFDGESVAYGIRVAEYSLLQEDYRKKQNTF